MNAIDCSPVVEVTRGSVVECIHFGTVAVVSADGKTLGHYGNQDCVTFLRSSAKPLQILPFLAAGGAERFGLTAEEVALMCASHGGSDEHVRVASSILSKIGAQESDLKCGTHPPLDDKVRLRLISEGKEPSPIRHNCSGKHAGFLAYARLLGEPLENYLDHDHPVQRSILENFADFCELDVEDVELGVDGCSAPVFAVPMRNAALAIARLSDPVYAPPKMQSACAQVIEAMQSYPLMVAGTDRFDTRLMQVGGGRWISKGGAEGYHIIGIRPGMLQSGQPGAGIAVKIADGNAAGRAVSIVALEALRQLGILSGDMADQLSEFDERAVYNWRHLEAGELRSCFTLQ